MSSKEKDQDQMHTTSVPGKVYLIGAGPGDPGLMTLRGRELLERCDAVVYDALVSREIVDWAPRVAERHYVGKQPGKVCVRQESIEALLVGLAREGKQVVRLKGGDPLVFGRGGEEALALVAAGVAFEIVPAVTAALGCAAYAGIPLTHRGIAASVTFVSGHDDPQKPRGKRVDWRSLARVGGTLCLYMAMGRLEAIVGELLAGGMDRETPAAAIQWGTTGQHRQVLATLATLSAGVSRSGMSSPAVVVIGEVARLAETLRWFVPEAKVALGLAEGD